MKTDIPNPTKKLIAIVGPTATGKSDLAVSLAVILAKKIGTKAEIISADSRQVYKGMDIGTGKITKKEMRSVRHYLLDIAHPRTVFTIAKFKKIVDAKIAALHYTKTTAKKSTKTPIRIPILVGGTGYYIQSIVDGIVPDDTPPNQKLRRRLANILGKKSATKNSQRSGLQKLQNMLAKLDPVRYQNIDKQNPVRLIRAIEIATAKGKVPPRKNIPPNFQVLMIGLDLPDDILKNKIRVRLEKRLKAGMLDEVCRLLDKKGPYKISHKRLQSLGLEYKYCSLFLQGKLGSGKIEDLVDKLASEIWHYAKRQRTWFKKDKRIKWFRPEEKNRIEKVVVAFVKRGGK